MIEAATDRRTRTAFEQAHLERGRALREALRWISGRRGPNAR